MFCGDQRHIGEGKQPPISHRKPARQGRQLFCGDIIVFKLILQSVSVFDSQVLSWATPESFQSRFQWSWRPCKSRTFCSAFQHVFRPSVSPAGCFCFACINQNCKLFTKGWNVRGGSNSGTRRARLSFQQVHDLSHCRIIFFSHRVYIQFFFFLSIRMENNSILKGKQRENTRWENLRSFILAISCLRSS